MRTWAIPYKQVQTREWENCQCVCVDSQVERIFDRVEQEKSEEGNEWLRIKKYPFRLKRIVLI